MTDIDWTIPDHWRGRVVQTGSRFVYLELEGVNESFTTDQARGIALALLEAAAEVDDARTSDNE